MNSSSSQAEIRKHFDDLLEKELQYHLQKLGTGKGVAQLIGELIELSYKKDHKSGEFLRAGLDFIMPEILKNTSVQNPGVDMTVGIEDIMVACIFGSHYRQCRDLIFCSFKSPEAITWELKENDIKITVNDKSYFRQLTSETQAFLMNSKTSIAKNSVEMLDELCKKVSYWDMEDPNNIALIEMLELEAENKINHYFDYIPRGSTVDIGGYSYSDFLKVFRSTLTMALYERLWNKQHESGSVVSYPVSDLARMLSMTASVDEGVCRRILKDLASASRGSFNYITQTDQFLLFPVSFTLIDHIAQVLKQYAKRDEKGFSSGCAGLIGSALVDKVAGHFSKYPNFKVITEVNLQKFDKSLPDIDVLSISYEPTFGFQIFINEVKNSLPATWAKEHLKLSDKKGALVKATAQIEALQKFVNTEQGMNLLYKLVKQHFSHLDFKKLFPNGFMGAINFIIVTPQNIGALLPSGDVIIINEDFLRHLINKSDGDSIYLKHHFNGLNKLLDESYEIISDSFKIGNTQINYDAASLKHVIRFSENEYLTTGTLEAIEKEGLELGYSYIDTFINNPDSADESEAAEDEADQIRKNQA